MHKQLGRYTVVLLGVGHTNAHVLRMWKMKQPKNAQLICVSDFPVVTYSGMLPGVLSGQYPRSAMEIDLIRLAQSAGARVIVAKVCGLDREQRQLLFDDRPPLSFDILSIGIGSRPSFTGVEVAEDPPLLAVKPMQTFLPRLGNRLNAIVKNNALPNISIVGGGVGSIEIACCLHERFYGKPRHVDEPIPEGLKPAITLITGANEIGSGLNGSTIEKIRQELDHRGIKTILSARVQSVRNDCLEFENGKSEPADVVIWATSAVAGPLLGEFDFEKDERGFLLTKSSLEVTTMPGVFAVGDSGTIVGSNINKAGVYAVRQGPVLFRNILKKISGSQQLEDFRPQSDFLKLINLGNDRAVAEYKGRSFSSRLAWKLKDYIDVKFMRKYQTYEPMEMKLDPADESPMRCLGCGGKIGSQILSKVLRELQVIDHPDVKIGLANPDDAAVIATHNNEVTVTTDFFAAPFEDPYLVGRIAALNSASDCFVMGARPTSALAIVQVPTGHPRGQTQVMREVMAGGIEELNNMNAAIVGGHSIEGPRMMIGFTVLGKQIVSAKTKGMLQPGDQLVVTKPVGTGILLAAWMQSAMPAEYYQPLIDSMLGSNEIAIELVEKFPVTALTDVTGFGLIGHLTELMMASGVSVELNRSAIPLLPGALELVEAGIESTLSPDNRSLSTRVSLTGLDTESNELAPLFDPQTGGGLLLGIDAGRLSQILEYLRESKFAESAVIGEVVCSSESPELKIV